MFCSKCGSPLKEGYVFCANCGAPVSPAAKQPANEEPIATEAPVNEPSVNDEAPANDTDTPITPTYIAPASVVASPAVQKKGFSITSMILGICALVFASDAMAISDITVAVACAVVGLIFGIIALNHAKKSELKKPGMALAGVICSSIAMGLIVITIVLSIIGSVLGGMIFGDLYGGDYGIYY